MCLNLKKKKRERTITLLVYLLFSLSIRFGLLDLRFWWGSPRPRSTSAGPTEAPCAPSVCVTGKVFVFSCFPAQFLYWVFCHYWRDLKWLIFNNHLYLFIFRIKRAFLIEEQKIVVKVLKAQAQSQKSK